LRDYLFTVSIDWVEIYATEKPTSNDFRSLLGRETSMQ